MAMITKNAASLSVVFRPNGDLDALTVEHYRQMLRPLLEDGYRFIILDLEEVHCVTSSGLGLLVELHNHVMKHEGTLKLINVGSRILWLLRQTKLDSVLLTAEDEVCQFVPFDPLHALMSQEILFCSKINDVAERALKSSDPDEIAGLILNGVVAACSSERGVFYLFAEDGGQARLAASSGLDPALQSLAAVVSLPPGYSSRPARPAEILFFREEEAEDSVLRPDVLKSLGFQRSVQIPIGGQNRNFGVILLTEPGSEAGPIDSFRPMLRTFANICGLALEKTELIQQCDVRNHDLVRTLDWVRKCQDALVDVGKLAALGAVVSGLGHLLNNKLVPIIGYTQLLARNPELPEKTKTQLDTVNMAAIELKDIMEKLIKVSRVREISQELVDTNEILERTVTLLRHQLDANRVSLDLQLEDAIPLLIADHDLLLQAFIAVIHRACTSFPEDGRSRWISIKTHNAGATLEIEFEDNGGGLGEMSSEDWLDPLVPYTELNQGRLFNYSIPRSVVRRHRGNLSLSEKEGGGTFVRISLPISRLAVPEVQNPQLADRTSHAA